MEAQFFNFLWFDIAYYLVKNGHIDQGVDIVNFKLVPSSDDDSEATYEPVKDLRNNFQVLVNELSRE